MSQEFDMWPTASEVYEDITEFDNTMFLADPLRAMKFSEFLSYISDNWLRVRLLRATKDSSFYQIADAFQYAHSKDYKSLWESNLPEAINNFLDELEKNENIEFSRNEIEEVQQALDSVFSLTNTWKTITWIKDRLLNLIS